MKNKTTEIEIIHETVKLFSQVVFRLFINHAPSWSGSVPAPSASIGKVPPYHGLPVPTTSTLSRQEHRDTLHAILISLLASRFTFFCWRRVK